MEVPPKQMDPSAKRSSSCGEPIFQPTAGLAITTLELNLRVRLFQSGWQTALARPPRLGSARESAAVERLRPLFRLRTRSEASLDPKDPRTLVIRAVGRLPKFGAYRYADLTNGSRFSTTDARGAVHHFVAVRAMREGYSVRADMRTGTFATVSFTAASIFFGCGTIRFASDRETAIRRFALR